MNYSNRTSCGCNNENMGLNNEPRYNSCGCMHETSMTGEQRERSCGCERNNCKCRQQERKSCSCQGERGTDLANINSRGTSNCNCNCKCKCKEKCNCRIINTPRGKLIYFFDNVKR
ncbi:hypothetical protein [Anaerofustis sp.]|uniref:hypothetical protein n=1 Tax=Anaerofustis sp. TaxID=1872517 RepID=UPI0025C40346|nr:hypothetical protein [Anaerofustis sp.]